MLILYDPTSHKYKGFEYYNKPWRWSGGPFDGVFGDRMDAGLCSWVVPGTWPEWML